MPSIDAAHIFGENLRWFRKEEKSDWAAYKFANLLNVSVQTLAAYERGDRVPPMSVLDRLYQEFDIAPAAWLTPDGPKQARTARTSLVEAYAPSVPHLTTKSATWAEEVWFLSHAIPDGVIATRLKQLSDFGLGPGESDLIRVVGQSGMRVEEIPDKWKPGTQAAFLSPEWVEADVLRVYQEADPRSRREDITTVLVSKLLELRSEGCRTWADSQTNVTKWHPAASRLFGYSMDPPEWRNLRIDSFAVPPKSDKGHCVAYDAVRALLAEKPNMLQRKMRAVLSFPLVRVERLYRKDESHFVAGITIRATDGPDETKLLVTVTNLEVPALIERLAREILVPGADLRRAVRRGGASVNALAERFQVHPGIVKRRMAETGIWSAVYDGTECLDSEADRGEHTRPA